MSAIRQRVLMVFIGGSIGSSVRITLLLAGYSLLSHVSGTLSIAMLTTLMVNMAGALLAGVLGRLYQANYLSESAWLLLGVGFCGGFTTASAFALDIFIAWQYGLVSLAAIYMLATLICTLLAAALGYFATTHILAWWQDSKTESSC